MVESAPHYGRLEPTAPGDRIDVLDTLRGFALLGILLINIISFSGISAGIQQWTDFFDQTVSEGLRLLIRGKFYSLFSIMFGIGFALHLDRFAARSRVGQNIYFRRLIILFAIGSVHFLLDPLGVLSVYAICGAFLLLFQRLSLKLTVLAALIIMPLPYLHTVVVSTWTTSEASPGSQSSELSAETEIQELAGDEESDSDSKVGWDPYVGERAVNIHSSGSLSDLVSYNLWFTINRFTSSWVSYLWMSVPLPLMLIGFCIGRSKILQRSSSNSPISLRSFLLCVSAGIGATFASETFYAQSAEIGWDPWLWFFGSVFWALSGLMMALGYAAGIILLFRHETWKLMFKPLQVVGRFALTNYLLQTVICTTIFYSYGIGLYGKIGPAVAVSLAVSIYFAQVVLSMVWGRYFRYGPAEWFWRSATYGKLQPMRIT